MMPTDNTGKFSELNLTVKGYCRGLDWLFCLEGVGRGWTL